MEMFHYFSIDLYTFLYGRHLEETVFIQYYAYVYISIFHFSTRDFINEIDFLTAECGILMVILTLF